MIDIRNLDKAEVLKVLYDASHHQGMGFLQAVPDSVVTVEHCRDLLASNSYFDYLYGKVMKVSLKDDFFDERMYDRDNGPGAAQKAINKLRKPDPEKKVKVAFDMPDGVKIDFDYINNEHTIQFNNRDALERMIRLCERCRKFYE